MGAEAEAGNIDGLFGDQQRVWKNNVRSRHDFVLQEMGLRFNTVVGRLPKNGLRVSEFGL